MTLGEDELVNGSLEQVDKINNAEGHEGDILDEDPVEGRKEQESSELAFKLINVIKTLNTAEISHHELTHSLTVTDELKCLYLIIKSLPYHPISAIYPETDFFFLKGVPIPKAYDLSEDTVEEVERILKNRNSEDIGELHLRDLDQYYLDAYEGAVGMYHEMVERSKNSYNASVKQAKSQVIEISSALVCGLVIVLALFSLS